MVGTNIVQVQNVDGSGDSNNNTKTPFLKVDKKEIYFEENWSIGIGGGLWSTGLCLSKYFIEHSDLLRHNLKQLASPSSSSSSSGIRAIELGSGNGLLGCCLAASVGTLLKELYITDLSDHLNLMKKTVLANSHILTLQDDRGEGDIERKEDRDSVLVHDNNNNSSTSTTKCICHVVEHAFGSPSNVALGKFDFIFGSDVAYRDYLHEPLIASLLQLSHENTISIIGVTMIDTKPKFFTSLWEAGFRYDRLPDHLMSHEFRGTTFGLFVIQRRSR
mmetsp:Transcript_16679/g.24936  ORF Transcript_16679/g.24936 Transcript_16679/m.24936 type:complete len:275 (-) Transcript_16679:560-1384(-)